MPLVGIGRTRRVVAAWLAAAVLGAPALPQEHLHRAAAVELRAVEVHRHFASHADGSEDPALDHDEAPIQWAGSWVAAPRGYIVAAPVLALAAHPADPLPSPAETRNLHGPVLEVCLHGPPSSRIDTPRGPPVRLLS